LVKKGFPSFGVSQSGAFVAALQNYNLPDFILVLVAKDCDSDYLFVEESMTGWLV